MDYAKVFRQYIFALFVVIKQILFNVRNLKLCPPTVFVPVGDYLVSLYYHYYGGLSSSTVDLDDQTTMHFLISNHRRHDRPNLVLIHGCGADARWQFLLQVKSLSESFNIYLPDLLFFGNSHTKVTDRSTRFQAKCVMEGLKKGFGVERCSVYSISYGGWVGYWMAEMYPLVVEKSVIVSTGIGVTVDQVVEELSKLGRRPQEIVVPRGPDELRLLAKRSIHKYDFSWIPDFILWEFIRMKDDKHRKEKVELIDNLMTGEIMGYQVRALSQETLLVWGEEDNIFPKRFGYQLQRLLGPEVRLEMIKATGHAINIDAPKELNHLIKSFILGNPAVA